MTMRSVPLRAALALFVFSAPAARAAGPPQVQGTWTLDAKASGEVPASLRGIDLKVTLKGKTLSTQRVFEGRPVGEPTVVSLDGVPVNRELGGEPGTIEARWIDGGAAIEQVVKTKLPGAVKVPVTQRTVITVSEDGRTMTRRQTTVQGGGEPAERVLVYRRRE